MKILVTGCNGQDGFYASNYLIQKGHKVFGISKKKSSISNENFKNKILDLNNLHAFEDYLYELNPDLILNFSVVHGSAGFNYEDLLIESYNVNVSVVAIILKFLRSNKNSKLSFISSSKVFESEGSNIINENSKRVNSCIYSFQKNYCNELINFYRKNHGVNASIFYTFNHDSLRRGSEFFIPKIAEILANSIKDKSYKTSIKTLNFFSDWGYAKEYAEIISKISLEIKNEDFIIATGNSIYAEDLVKSIFKSYKLDFKDHIFEEKFEKHNSAKKLIADISKLKSFGYEIKYNSYDVLKILVEHIINK